jgi:hypothetical protein
MVEDLIKTLPIRSTPIANLPGHHPQQVYHPHRPSPDPRSPKRPSGNVAGASRTPPPHRIQGVTRYKQQPPHRHLQERLVIIYYVEVERGTNEQERFLRNVPVPESSRDLGGS